MAIARLGDHSDLRRPGHGDHLASAAVGALDPQRAWPKSVDGGVHKMWVDHSGSICKINYWIRWSFYVILIHFESFWWIRWSSASNGSTQWLRRCRSNRIEPWGWSSRVSHPFGSSPTFPQQLPPSNFQSLLEHLFHPFSKKRRKSWNYMELHGTTWAIFTRSSVRLTGSE